MSEINTHAEEFKELIRQSTERGQVFLIAVVFFAVLFTYCGILLQNMSVQVGGARRSVGSAQALAVAEAGIDKATYELNQNPSYSGETNTYLPGGTFTTTVTSIDSSTKLITSTAVSTSTGQVMTKIIKAKVSINSNIVSFTYGVQAGNGGFQMQNNSYVAGNIFANGSVIGSSGTYATGTVVVAGGTALIADQEHTVNNADYPFGRVTPVLDVAQSFTLSADNFVNKISLYIRKTGSPSNRTVYILADNNGVPSKTILASATLSAASVTSNYSWVDVTFATPPPLVSSQTYWLAIDTSASASNYYSLAGDTTEAYANGIAMYSASWNATAPAWNAASRDFNFKVWTGGVNTMISGLRVYQTAKAHRIENSDIDGDAYYQEISGTTVDGASFPGSADSGPASLPISDGQIEDWKQTAEQGEVSVGDATHTNGCAIALGPKKIVGNLTISNGCVVTITGEVYVTGNITISNNVTMKLSSTYAGGTGVIVADGKVDVNNNVVFQNSGTAGSYILVLSTNPSVDSEDPAIDLGNNGSAAIFYAANGMIKISNNASVKEVTAFKVYLENGASVRYESGLANVNFSSGPGGSWTYVPGTYTIVE